MFDEERAILQAWEKQFQDRIAELEAENQRLREANPWIPVTERLPEVEGYYYCEIVNPNQTCKNYGSLYVMQKWWNGSFWNVRGLAKVIAWREMLGGRVIAKDIDTNLNEVVIEYPRKLYQGDL